MPSDTPDIKKAQRFKRSLATWLCVVPFLFAAQSLLVTCNAPTFAAMFSDFGAKLPAPTQLVLDSWVLWVLVSLLLPVAALCVARLAAAGFAVFFSAACGLGMFLIAQFVTIAMFLPVFQLGAVAAQA